MADTTTKLVGHNYTPPDLVVKMTGQAKYAEYFRAEGMLFTKLLLSPMPHAQVRNIGASAALVMPGVHAILTEEDCPNPGSAMLGEGVVNSDEQNITPEMILTNEPRYQGELILAVAADSIERIVVDLEPLRSSSIPSRRYAPGHPTPARKATCGSGTTSRPSSGSRRIGRRSRRGGCRCATRPRCGRSGPTTPVGSKGVGEMAECIAAMSSCGVRRSRRI